MHPSSSTAFEPGLDRGVPWGRDLFTFVTSAAGHMMRTLQKPRKNKPSKRQVNHRRFLHNMIQRKFSEIEAANQQLASALFSVDTSQSQSEVKSSHKNDSLKNMEKAMANTCDSETPTKQQDEGNDSRTLNGVVVNPKALNHLNRGEGIESSQPWENVEEFEHFQETSLQQTTDFTCGREHVQSTSADLDNLTQVTNIMLEESVFSWLENIERRRQDSNVDALKSPDLEQQYLGITFDMSPLSPAVSPLLLDFEEQIQHESEQSSDMQCITDSLQMDIMESPELLDLSKESMQSPHVEQRHKASVWQIQSEEEQSCLQDDFTFLNTTYEGYMMDDQVDCVGGVNMGDVEVPMPLDSSVKHINVEHDLRCTDAWNLEPCGLSYYQNQTRYPCRHRGLTKDCHEYHTDTDSTTKVRKDGHHSAGGTWSISEKNSPNLEEDTFSDPFLDSQTLQRHWHGHPKYALTKYWDQQHIHKSPTASRGTDPYHVLTDAGNNNIQSGATLNSNSSFSSPLNPVSSSTANISGFDMLTQRNSDCRGDSCSYPDCEVNGNIPCFDGVAQSFPAPLHKHHPHPVSTPPLNDDWLFSNIVSEDDFNCPVRSPECTYC